MNKNKNLIIVFTIHRKKLADKLVLPLFIPNIELTVLAAEEIELVGLDEKDGIDTLKLKLDCFIAGSIIFKITGKNI